MKKLIPDRIKLMSRDIKVVFEEDLIFKEDRRGEARFRRDEIAILQRSNAHPISVNQQVETYYHELLHWILELLEEKELSENERLIEMMGKLFAQAALSAKYREGDE